MVRETETLICSCYSFEHQINIWNDEEFDELYFYIHLTTNRNFFQRLWYGLRYAFGYKSRFGAWDEFLLNEETALRLRDIINEKYESK